MMRVALVTGSSRGIGAQCARALAKEGYAVCINCIERTDKAEALAEELKANGASAIWQQADVADALAVRGAVRQAVEAARSGFCEEIRANISKMTLPREANNAD